MYPIQSKQIGVYFILMLFAGLLLNACNDSPVSSFPEEEDMELTTHEGNDLMSNTQVSSNIIIDSFSSGGGSWSACASATFNFHEDASIFGGARELVVREAYSCQYGGKAWLAIDDAAGTAEWYSVGNTAAMQSFNYGTAIGTWSKGTQTNLYGWDAWGPNRDAGSELNLSLTLDDQIRVDMAQVSSGPFYIYLYDGAGTRHGLGSQLTAGTNLIPLSDFTTLTEAGAADIDGISFWGGVNSNNGLGSGNVFTSISIEPVVTNNVYISDNSVDTYDPLFPETEDLGWKNNVCKQSNDFGISATWSNPHKAFQVTQDPSPNGAPHPWESNTFDAYWINAVNDMDSPDTIDINGNAGPGGHNWTRYETDVAGNGEFVVQLVADNCSWVYLADENGDSPELVGYQATSAAGEFGVNLDGDHKLIFIIFDGGGLAGGKFRLETTESFGGTPPPPIAPNTAPVADAGANQTLDATGQTTPVTLDGSGSSDADGDTLSYSWTLNGNEVATTAIANVNLADGSYTLTLTVSDGELSDSDEVNVTVVNTIPEADAGPNQTKEATGATTPVTLTGSGSDADGDALTYLWSNGDMGTSTTVDLGVGVHTFTLTVADGQGASATDDVVITITDSTAPVLSFNQATGNLWPPNHKMVLVATGISASDIVDGATDVSVTVISSEASNGNGDGNTNSDWEVVSNPDGTQDVYVRSERSGKGNGRTYTITLNTSDVAGNSSSESFEVNVAKSKGRGR